MSKKQVLLFLIITCVMTIFTISTGQLFASELKSNNFKIIDVNTNSGGDIEKSSSNDFKLLNTMNPFTGDPRLTSANYRAGLGNIEVFIANTPKISCFETDSNGSSSCTTGPTYLNTGGMVTVCGTPGCYDRARFEIDAQRNPADALYGIQISTDNFVNDIKYVDGVTKQPKASSSRTLSDYLTKANWETPTFNVAGLQASTTYYLRALALHGDFTESDPGPIVSKSTTAATSNFDIDIADINGVSSETSAPYDVTLSSSRKLIQTGPAQTAESLIWFDIDTNARGGFAVVVKGDNAGLYSASKNYTINSVSNDLDSILEGFGIQNFYMNQQFVNGSGNGELGTISARSVYAQAGNTVGIINSVYNVLYEANTAVKGGRTAVYVKARVSNAAPESTDYTENIKFVLVPRY